MQPTSFANVATLTPVPLGLPLAPCRVLGYKYFSQVANNLLDLQQAPSSSSISSMVVPVLHQPISSSAFVRGEPLCAAVISSSIVRTSIVHVRASAKRETDASRVAKTTVAAATLALVVSAASPSVSNIQAAYAGDTTAAEKILAQSKADGNAAFAEAQRTGKETVGAGAEKVANGEAAPAISQVHPAAEEASDDYADRVAERAQLAADAAPGTSQQEGKGSDKQNLEKAFATPTRGLADKEGANEGRFSNVLTQRDEDVPYSGGRLTGKDSSQVAEVPNLIDRVKDVLGKSAEGRDGGRKN